MSASRNRIGTQPGAPQSAASRSASTRSASTQSALRRALLARADELGIDPETIWYPSPHALAARRPDGGLLRLDFGDWPAPELGR